MLVRRQLQKAPDTGHEIGDLAGVEGVVQRQHRHAVADRGELGRDRRTDHLGRRIGHGQLGESALDLDRPALQRVVVGVGNLGRVVAVIQGVVTRQLGGQVGEFLPGLVFGQLIDGGVGHGNRVRSGSSPDF